MDCQHTWDYSAPTLDFGRYGIRTRTCTRCGARESSDSDSGEWPTPAAILSKIPRHQWGCAFNGPGAGCSCGLLKPDQ